MRSALKRCTLSQKNKQYRKKSTGFGTTIAPRSDSQGKIRRLDSYWPRCYCTGVSTQKLHSVFNQRQIQKTKSLCDFMSLTLGYKRIK